MCLAREGGNPFEKLLIKIILWNQKNNYQIIKYCLEVK